MFTRLLKGKANLVLCYMPADEIQRKILGISRPYHQTARLDSVCRANLEAYWMALSTRCPNCVCSSSGKCFNRPNHVTLGKKTQGSYRQQASENQSICRSYSASALVRVAGSLEKPNNEIEAARTEISHDQPNMGNNDQLH